MQQRNTDSRVVAVVPTFNPSPDLLGRLEALRDQVSAIVVADDGSGRGASRLLPALESQGAHVVRWAENTGIAAALNRGIAVAFEYEATHIVTVDQDSTLASGYVAAALRTMARVRDAGGAVLAVGAGIIDGDPMPTTEEFAGVPRIAETLQSGLVFDVSALRDLGPFDESLFIDCVDTEMLLRGAAHGMHTYLSRDCRLEHQLGETHEAALLGRRMNFAYHGPLRRYYITRNRAKMKVRFARRFPRWALVQLRDQTRFFVISVVFGPNRPRQLVAFTAGLLDAARGRGGRISPRLAGWLAA